MSYQVTINNKQRIQVVDVNQRSTSISNSVDIDISNRQDNSILIWNDTKKKHEYVPVSYILGSADGVADDAIDYGSY